MTASEKVAYLKGLAEGLGINKDSAEGKLMLAMVDMLGGMASDIEDLEANAANMAASIDELSSDIAYVEDLAMGDIENEEKACECECECESECSECESECAECEACESEQQYEIACPKCNESILICESDLEAGSILCPACGSKLELDVEEENIDE